MTIYVNQKDLTIKELARQCRTMDDIADKLKEIFKDTLQEGLRIIPE